MSVKQEYDKAYEDSLKAPGADPNMGELVFRDYLVSQISRTINYYERRQFKKWIEVYKAYNLFTGDIKAKNKALDMEWREASAFPLIKMMVDTLFASLYDSDVKFKVLPRNPSDEKKATKFQALVNWIFDNAKVREKFYQAMKEALLIGVSFLKVGFISEDDTITYNYKGKTKSVTYHNFEPLVEKISPFNLFVDPYAKSVDTARYVFYRKIVPISVALREYKDLVKLNPDTIRKIKKNPRYCSNRDYNIIHKIQYYSDLYSEWANNNIDTENPTEILSELENLDVLNFFEILNGENDLIEVIEYYKDNNLLILFNGYIVYDGKTTYPIKGYPFVSINYEVGGGLYSKGVGVNLLDFQKASNLLFNTNIDAVKLAISPMFEANMHTLEEDFVGDYFKVEPFRIIKKKGDGEALTPMQLIQPNQLGLQTINELISYVENSEGPNQYSMGGSPVERSATGASLKAQIVKQRLKPLLDNVNGALTELMKKMAMILINQLNSAEKQDLSIRIDDDFGGTTFEQITIEDILGQYDIILELNSLKSTTIDTEKHQLIEFIQVALQTVDQDPVKGRPLIDREALLRKLVNLYNLPSDVILTDDRFINKEKKQEQFKEKLQKTINKGNPQPQINLQQGQQKITPEMLANAAKNATPEDAQAAAEAEQQHEMYREMKQINPLGNQVLRRGQNYF